MAQQSYSQVSPLPPARESNETIVDTSSVLVHQPDTLANSLQASAEIISHKIDKIIKKNSVGYFCNTCNTHYSRLLWVIEDHPGTNIKKFGICDLRKGLEI